MGRKPEQREAVKAYLLEHPEAKDVDVRKALGASAPTVARARWDLIDEGLLPPTTRRASTRPKSAPSLPAAPKTPAREPNALMTGEELLELGADLDSMDGLDDEVVRTRMLKSLRKLAFDSLTNNDTRLTAMSLWFKLKDIASIKALGPGVPMTPELAIARLKDLLAACGIAVAIKAAIEAFSLPSILTYIQHLIGVPNEGQAPTQPVEAELGSAGTPEAQGSDPDLPAPDGPTGPL